MQRYPEESDFRVLPGVYETREEALAALDDSWRRYGPTV